MRTMRTIEHCDGGAVVDSMTHPPRKLNAPPPPLSYVIALSLARGVQGCKEGTRCRK